MHIHAVILAGGRGERFWPLSRRRRPKQFIPLAGDRSLLQESFSRLDGWIPAERRWIVAGTSLYPTIRAQLPALDPDRCVAEPVARNTAAAIGAAAALVEANDPQAIILVLPSDHWIPDADDFRRDVERAAAAASDIGGLHLFGIPIAYPETGYGYVESGSVVPGHPGTHRVIRFHEKPDREKAIAYASRSDMLWNSGIFVWGAPAILEAITEHVPEGRAALGDLRATLQREGGLLTPVVREALDRFFLESPGESIDYAVLERHKETFVTHANFRWSDLGNWISWGVLREADSDGNRGQGRGLILESENCVYHSGDGGLVALLGVKDLIVVRLDDVTLVCSRERAQDVRLLARRLANDPDLETFS
jgi:mannose-1-phosphate guanylyltransferase